MIGNGRHAQKPSAGLLGGEALPGVQADALTVEHRILHDCDSELGVLVGAPSRFGNAASDLADLTLERRDRRRVDNDAPLLGLVVDGFVLAHLPRGQSADVEGAYEVEVDAGTERVQAVRTVLLE